MTVATRPLSQAVLAALRAEWPLVGDGIAPPTGLTFDGQGRLLQPYGVLYRGGPGELDGPMSDPHADGSPMLQLTCVGGAPDEAEWLADKLRPVLLSRTAVVGWAHMESPSLVVSQPSKRDDTTQPPLWFAVDQARYRITPT